MYHSQTAFLSYLLSALRYPPPPPTLHQMFLRYTCPFSILLPLILLLLFLSHPAYSHPQPLHSLPLSLPLPQTLHGVDDVGPAFANATAAGLAKAQAILVQYSDLLRIISIPTGLAATFFGYFLLSPVLFLAAFVTGGGFCFISIGAILGEDTPLAAWLSIAAMLLGGALLGFIALRALNVGMFAVGAALGVVFASAVKASLIAQAYPKDPELAFRVVAVVCGVLFGLLALCLQKQMLIFSTAYAGSGACMFGIGHFAGHFPTSADLGKVEKGELDGWVLGYILATLLLGTGGMMFQFWLGKNKPMPTHAPHDRRRRRRRVRQYEPEHDEWSDDNGWGEDVFVERAPARRKMEVVVRPEVESATRRDEGNLKVEVAQPARRTSYTERSWINVRNADEAFEIGELEETGTVKARGAKAKSRLDEVTEVVQEGAANGAHEDSRLSAKDAENAEQIAEIKVLAADGTQASAAGKGIQAGDLGAGPMEHGSPKLVDVSLESDLDSPLQKR